MARSAAGSSACRDDESFALLIPSSFALSISFLSLAQATLIAMPRPVRTALVPRLQGRWWALVPPASIAVTIGLVAISSRSADALTYLALVAVPPLASVALARLVPAAQPALALAVFPLFAAAWLFAGALAGDFAALLLSALACVTLGTLLASNVPHHWLRLGLYAMAIVDACLVAADLLQGPNAVLNAAAPGSDLPRLQAVHFGSAVMGFGDLFIAATAGALLAPRPRTQLAAALFAAAFGLGFDLLFLGVDELPTTVPVAAALLAVEMRDRPQAGRISRP